MTHLELEVANNRPNPLTYYLRRSWRGTEVNVAVLQFVHPFAAPELSTTTDFPSPQFHDEGKMAAPPTNNMHLLRAKDVNITFRIRSHSY